MLNLDAVLIALFGSLTAFFTWRTKEHSKRSSAKLEDNIDMVTEAAAAGSLVKQVHSGVAEIKAEVTRGYALTSASIDGLAQVLNEHIAEDDRRFAAVDRRLVAMRSSRTKRVS